MLGHMPRRGFTIIELLVVIAIVAILFAILLPTLAGAKMSGKQIKCLSNQKQIGTALAMYANEYDEWTPRESGVSELVTRNRPLVPAWKRNGNNQAAVNISWAFTLRPLLDGRTNSSLAGHGIQDSYEGAPYYKDPARLDDGHQIHYVNNGLKFREVAGRPVVTTLGKPPTRFSKYLLADRTMYLTCFIDDPGFRWQNNYAPGNDNLQISIFYDMWNPSSVDGRGPDTPTEAQRVAAKRHGVGPNCLFLDSHAELVPAREATDPMNWNDYDYTKAIGER